jgi:thiamine kinase-like enzyme
MLIGLLENCSSPLVFWHNDALLANIVLKKTEEVIFIDMEYG